MEFIIQIFKFDILPKLDFLKILSQKFLGFLLESRIPIGIP